MKCLSPNWSRHYPAVSRAVLMTVPAIKRLVCFHLGNSHEAPVTKLVLALISCRQSSANNSASKNKIATFSFRKLS
jgi:hypothetical protein